MEDFTFVFTAQGGETVDSYVLPVFEYVHDIGFFQNFAQHVAERLGLDDAMMTVIDDQGGEHIVVVVRKDGEPLIF